MAKKKKLRIRWKNVILLALAVFLVVYLLTMLIGALAGGSGGQDSADSFTACRLSTARLRKELEGKEYEGTIQAGDAVFYGEYLNLYAGEYSPGASDDFAGRTIILKDLCSDNVITVEKAGSAFGAQLDLRDVPNGFYEVYVVENLLNKRVYMPQKLSSSYAVTLAAQDGKHRTATLIADQGLVNAKNAQQDVMDRNYLFLDVRDSSADSSGYDIVLYPGPVIETEAFDITENGVTASEELYQFVSDISAILETDGYKVLIARSQGESVSIYGSGGIASRAYSSGARYMVSFDFRGYGNTGMRTVHSQFASDAFAVKIYEALSAAGLSGEYGSQSVLSSESTEEGYDADFDIRETGGKALGAGKMPGASQEQDAAFADLNGLETVYVSLGNLGDEGDVTAWKTNYDSLVQAAAQGIEAYLKGSE